uniref:Uncharacterized protein n=1 Tax=Oryza meridionalis TaxID=40149 RepID=A0A0E0CTQ5_9ORYZ
MVVGLEVGWRRATDQLRWRPRVTQVEMVVLELVGNVPYDYAFGHGNSPRSIVEVPLFPRQRSLGENHVHSFGRVMTASFGIATFVKVSFSALGCCCRPGGD